MTVQEVKAFIQSSPRNTKCQSNSWKGQFVNFMHYSSTKAGFRYLLRFTFIVIRLLKTRLVICSSTTLILLIPTTYSCIKQLNAFLWWMKWEIGFHTRIVSFECCHQCKGAFLRDLDQKALTTLLLLSNDLRGRPGEVFSSKNLESTLFFNCWFFHALYRELDKWTTKSFFFVWAPCWALVQ